MDLLIYSESESVRVDYIFHHIFNHIVNYIFGLEVHFTHDSGKFTQHIGPKINYSKKAFSDELFFYASDLLFEENLKIQDISCSTYNGIHIFFLCNKGALPFDPFAASFYMLTRYEEYLPHKRDIYERFPATESIAYKKDFLQEPLIDRNFL